MKKRLLALLITLPEFALAHTGHGAHSHPEEVYGGFMLVAAVVGAYYIWKRFR
ncbi:hypothetical protein ACXJY6_03200 [Vibrio sp. RC27]